MKWVKTTATGAYQFLIGTWRENYERTFKVLPPPHHKEARDADPDTQEKVARTYWKFCKEQAMWWENSHPEGKGDNRERLLERTIRSWKTGPGKREEEYPGKPFIVNGDGDQYMKLYLNMAIFLEKKGELK